jgi:Rieske Fe-S protein
MLLGVGLAGVGAAVAGCSTAPVPYDDNPPGVTQGSQPSPQPSGGTPLGAESSIPVGSGVIFTKENVVVTQPVKGKLLAFSTFCTHMGCNLDQIGNGTIDCPCHGSKFKITDGAPSAGPAATPLQARQITVTNGNIMLLN